MDFFNFYCNFPFYCPKKSSVCFIASTKYSIDGDGMHIRSLCTVLHVLSILFWSKEQSAGVVLFLFLLSCIAAAGLYI